MCFRHSRYRCVASILMNQSEMPILFFPGLSGDPRVLEPQVRRFPSMKVARWLPPDSAESLASYAKRMALSLDPGSPCLVGGVSFGGIVAQEAACHLQARGCIVIASCRDASGLPSRVRLMRPLASCAGPSLTKWVMRRAVATTTSTLPRVKRRLARLSPEEREFREWALGAMLRWQAPESLGCPLFQIHGERDDTFAYKRSKADLVVLGAGHLLTITHAEKVNAFLSEVFESCSRPLGQGGGSE